METFFNIFESYGLTGILLSLICVVLYFVIKYYGNKLTNDMTNGLEKIGKEWQNLGYANGWKKGCIQERKAYQRS